MNPYAMPQHVTSAALASASSAIVHSNLALPKQEVNESAPDAAKKQMLSDRYVMCNSHEKMSIK